MMPVHNAIKQRHHRDETAFWVSRPLDIDLLEYASFDIAQMQALYKSYHPTMGRYPYIAAESKRYVELYRDSRRPADAWYVDHGVLPQEILERSDRAKLRWDELETKKCGACRRDLHQDSFPIAFQNKSQWLKRENGPLCYTCRQAKYFRDNPRPRRY